MQHTSEKTTETLGTKACNIRVQPLQHMQHPDLLCNIYMKHLQHTAESSKTLETGICNMHFQAQYLLVAWTKWRLVDAELDANAEVHAADELHTGDLRATP